MATDVPLAPSDDQANRLANLFDAHHLRLYRLARRLTTGPDDALDLVQDTFVRAARSPASIPTGASSEEAWLVRTLVNLRRDQWRKAAVRKRHDSERSPSVESGNVQEAALLARVVVWRALDALTPRRRAVVVMHELEGLPEFRRLHRRSASRPSLFGGISPWVAATLPVSSKPASGGTDEDHE